MQQLPMQAVAMFIYMATVYPICAALMFYRPLQCRQNRVLLWWLGTIGSMLLKAVVNLGEGVGMCPPGAKVVVSAVVSFVSPILLVYCFEEPLTVKGICFFVAAIIDTALTMPGILLTEYLSTRVGPEFLPAEYLLQALMQFISLSLTIRLLRIAKTRIIHWPSERLEQLALCGGLCYLAFICFATVTGYRQAENGTVGMASLVVTVLMLHALLFAVLFEAYTENSTLRDTVTELSDWRTMQYNALRMQQKSLDALRICQHDIKNHYLALQGFLARGEIEQAENYLRELTESAPTPVTHFTENPIADVALADAALHCGEQGIAFTVSGVLPAELPMTATDLGCLLYNLLSNAIEGALRAPTPRSVAIRFAVKAQQLCITVTNTALPETGQNLRTSKADAENHGFGTRIIRDIATRYDGMYTLQRDDNMAEADTMISLVPQELPEPKKETTTV